MPTVPSLIKARLYDYPCGTKRGTPILGTTITIAIYLSTIIYYDQNLGIRGILKLKHYLDLFKFSGYTVYISQSPTMNSFRGGLQGIDSHDQAAKKPIKMGPNHLGTKSSFK